MRWWLLCLVLITFWAQAASSPSHLNHQQKNFKELYSQAQQGELDPQNPRLKSLESYILTPFIWAAYYHWQLDHDPSIATDKDIAQFVQEYRRLPVAQRLRKAWLNSLAKRKQWRQVVHNTYADDATAEQCRAVNALIKLGQHPKAKALKYWQVGQSQPVTCDPVFSWLEEQGYLDDGQVLVRAQKAFLNKNYALAEYLAKDLSGQPAQQINLWLAVTEDAQQLKAASDLPETIFFHAFQRYALRDTQAAAEDYARLVKQFKPSHATEQKMQRYIALLLAQELSSNQALVWFDQLDSLDDHAQEWAVRAALATQNWPQVLKRIIQMPLVQSDRDEWQYWLGRAMAATGRRVQAHKVFAELAQERSYYGFLAAEQVGAPYAFGHQAVLIDEDTSQALRQRPEWQRTIELNIQGMDWQFRSAWQTLIARTNRQEHQQLARMAYQQGWYRQAILALSAAQYWDDLTIRFPTPYKPLVIQAARHNDLPPAFIYAIIRAESLFFDHSTSPVGARGLMQLMPTTADFMAQLQGEPAPSAEDLNVPGLNIKLGSRYLNKVMDRFDRHIAMAAAAYNAGPTAVNRWRPEQRAMPADIWIANIPYTETRHYVEQVLYHVAIYQYRMQQNIRPMHQRLSPIPPKEDKS